MAMKIETCITRLEARIKKLNTQISKKTKECNQLPKELSREQRLEAINNIGNAIRDAEVFIEQLQMILNILKNEANAGDKAEIVDKGDVKNRAIKFDYAEDIYNEACVSAYRCINSELNADALENVETPDNVHVEDEDEALFEYYQDVQMEDEQKVSSKFKEQVTWVIGLATL